MLFVTSPSQNDIASAQEREEYDLQIKRLGCVATSMFQVFQDVTEDAFCYSSFSSHGGSYFYQSSSSSLEFCIGVALSWEECAPEELDLDCSFRFSPQKKGERKIKNRVYNSEPIEVNIALNGDFCLTVRSPLENILKTKKVLEEVLTLYDRIFPQH